MRRRARTDDNHAEIVARFRAWPGVTVHDASRMGEGFPDLVVGCCGVTLLVEVKDGAKPPSRRKLNREEAAWHAYWTGHACVVETVEQADALVHWARQRYARLWQDAVESRRGANRGDPMHG